MSEEARSLKRWMGSFEIKLFEKKDWVLEVDLLEARGAVVFEFWVWF